MTGHHVVMGHLARMFVMMGQALRRKIPFAAISEDAIASQALEIVGQFFQLVLIICLAIAYLGLSGYPISAAYCLFYWLFVMGHYFSVANAVAKKETIQKWVDIVLLAYGAFTFICYVIGNTLLQKILSGMYFVAMIGRYAYFFTVDCVKASKVQEQIGGATISKE